MGHITKSNILFGWRGIEGRNYFKSFLFGFILLEGKGGEENPSRVNFGSPSILGGFGEDGLNYFE